MVEKGLVAGLAGGVQKADADLPAVPKVPGAVHSADIEYQMGNLPTNEVFAWNADDYAVSEIFVKMFVNFIKTGNPNGLGLPHWEPINGKEVAPVMMIDVDSRQEQNPQRERARNSFRLWQPISSALATPSRSASASVCHGRLSMPSTEPLEPIACAIISRQSGDAINALTDSEPADSPIIVIR